MVIPRGKAAGAWRVILRIGDAYHLEQKTLQAHLQVTYLEQYSILLACVCAFLL